MTMRWHYLDMIKEVAKKKMQEIYSQKEDERYKKKVTTMWLSSKKMKEEKRYWSYKNKRLTKWSFKHNR